MAQNDNDQRKELISCSQECVGTDWETTDPRGAALEVQRFEFVHIFLN